MSITGIRNASFILEGFFTGYKATLIKMHNKETRFRSSSRCGHLSACQTAQTLSNAVVWTIKRQKKKNSVKRRKLLVVSPSCGADAEVTQRWGSALKVNDRSRANNGSNEQTSLLLRPVWTDELCKDNPRGGGFVPSSGTLEKLKQIQKQRSGPHVGLRHQISEFKTQSVLTHRLQSNFIFKMKADIRFFFLLVCSCWSHEKSCRVCSPRSLLELHNRRVTVCVSLILSSAGGLSWAIQVNRREFSVPHWNKLSELYVQHQAEEKLIQHQHLSTSWDFWYISPLSWKLCNKMR